MPIEIRRRDLLLGSASAAAAVAALPLRPASAAGVGGVAPLAPAGPLTQRVESWLVALDAKQRKAAAFAWAGREWRNWNYFGASGYVKPGLRLEQMTGEQQDAAWAMLSAVLSPEGVEKARNVMALQDVLSAMGDGAGQRSSKRFSFAVFGAPSPKGAWGLRVEGHHLSLSFAVRDNQIVSVSPAAFAAKPAHVRTGPRTGLVTLRGEEEIARRLEADLAPELRKRARVADRHLFNILSMAGSERDNARKAGLAAADMTSAQRDLLWELVETFAARPYAGALATAQRQRVRLGDKEALHFAWYGPNEAGRSFGYRVIGDNLVIEMGCIDGEAQHLHPVYHDLANTLGTA